MVAVGNHVAAMWREGRCVRRVAFALVLACSASLAVASQGDASITRAAKGVAGDDANVVLVPLSGCRIADTRETGGPLLQGDTRSFDVAAGNLDAQGGDPVGCAALPPGTSMEAVLVIVSTWDTQGTGALLLTNDASAGATGEVPFGAGSSGTTLHLDLGDRLQRIVVSAQGTGSAHLTLDVVGYFRSLALPQLACETRQATAPFMGGSASVAPAACPAGMVSLGMECSSDASVAAIQHASEGGCSASLNLTMPATLTAVRTCCAVQSAVDADLSITHMVVPGTQPGDSAGYTTTVSNHGPRAAGGVVVTHAFSPLLEDCVTVGEATAGVLGVAPGAIEGDLVETGLTLPVAGAVTYTSVCSIRADAVGDVDSTAVVRGPVGDPDLSNNSARATFAVAATADVFVVIAAQGSAIPGEALAFTVTLANVGPGQADGVHLVAPLDDALHDCSTQATGSNGATGFEPGPVLGDIDDDGIVLPDGGSVVYAVTCAIDPAAITPLDLVAAATTTSTDPATANNAGSATVQLQPTADVSLVITSDADGGVVQTDFIQYQLVATNAGPSTAMAVRIDDVRPDGRESCLFQVPQDDGVDVAPGEAASFGVVCRVAADATGSLEYAGTVTSDTFDPVEGNNAATVSDDVIVARVFRDDFEMALPNGQ